MMTIGLDALIAVFFATIVLVAKPGPYVLAVSSMVASGQWRKCVVFLIGGYLGATFVYLLLLTGLTYIKQFDLGFLFFLLKSLAAAWFIWLGIKGFMQRDVNLTAAEDRKRELEKSTDLEDFIAGFILSNTNPYIIIFVTGVIPGLVQQEVFSIADILAIRGAVILADMLTLMLYIVPMMLLHEFTGGKTLRAVKDLSSALMIGIGLYIGYTAIMADDLMVSGIIG